MEKYHSGQANPYTEVCLGLGQGIIVGNFDGTLKVEEDTCLLQTAGMISALGSTEPLANSRPA